MQMTGARYTEFRIARVCFWACGILPATAINYSLIEATLPVWLHVSIVLASSITIGCLIACLLRWTTERESVRVPVSNENSTPNAIADRAAEFPPQLRPDLSAQIISVAICAVDGGAGITVSLDIRNAGTPSIADNFAATLSSGNSTYELFPAPIPPNASYADETGEMKPIKPSNTLYEKLRKPIASGERVRGVLFYFAKGVSPAQLTSREPPEIVIRFRDVRYREYTAASQGQKPLYPPGIVDQFAALTDAESESNTTKHRQALLVKVCDLVRTTEKQTLSARIGVIGALIHFSFEFQTESDVIWICEQLERGGFQDPFKVIENGAPGIFDGRKLEALKEARTVKIEITNITSFAGFVMKYWSHAKEYQKRYRAYIGAPEGDQPAAAAADEVGQGLVKPIAERPLGSSAVVLGAGLIAILVVVILAVTLAVPIRIACWDIPISERIPPALTTALVLIVLAIAATPYFAGQRIGPLTVPTVSQRFARFLLIAGPLFVIAVALLLFVPLQVLLRQNCTKTPIRNPSAEEFIEDGPAPMPLYWAAGQWLPSSGRLEAATDRTHSGSRSFKLSADIPNTLNWRQAVRLEPHSTYLLRAWIIADGVAPSTQDNDRGANIAIHFISPAKFPQSSERLLDTGGEWRRVPLQFTTREEATEADVLLQLGAESGMTTGR